jgi:hypothetical protein
MENNKLYNIIEEIADFIVRQLEEKIQANYFSRNETVIPLSGKLQAQE